MCLHGCLHAMELPAHIAQLRQQPGPLLRVAVFGTLQLLLAQLDGEGQVPLRHALQRAEGPATSGAFPPGETGSGPRETASAETEARRTIAP